jgi:hypothetical protein
VNSNGIQPGDEQTPSLPENDPTGVNLSPIPIEHLEADRVCQELSGFFQDHPWVGEVTFDFLAASPDEMQTHCAVQVYTRELPGEALDEGQKQTRLRDTQQTLHALSTHWVHELPHAAGFLRQLGTCAGMGPRNVDNFLEVLWEMAFMEPWENHQARVEARRLSGVLPASSYPRKGQRL